MAPLPPCFTTSTEGSGSTARIAAAPPLTPHASSASSSPTNTMSACRASSSSTRGPSASRHKPVRWFTSKETRGRSAPEAVNSRTSSRQVSDRAAVIPERCSTRPARTAARSTFSTDIAEAADPAR